jgi:hypothetical protein
MSHVMLREWQAHKETQLACGHRVKAGAAGYTLSLLVCAHDAACLPQAIKGCFEALKVQQAQSSWLYRLWHAWFGKPQPLPKQAA